jgi:hypothetical protein
VSSSGGGLPGRLDSKEFGRPFTFSAVFPWPTSFLPLRLRYPANFRTFPTDYNPEMERKIFWILFTVLGLVADFMLPIWWALGATIPIVVLSWWVAYRSGWFE